MTEPTVTQADEAMWEVIRDWPDGTTPREWTLRHLARHREQALAEGVAMGIEAGADLADRECNLAPDDCCLDTLGDAAATIRNLDPAAIIAQNKRTKALSELAEADAELLDYVPVGDSDGDDGA
jgi:hypothetical protein